MQNSRVTRGHVAVTGGGGAGMRKDHIKGDVFLMPKQWLKLAGS